MNSSMIPDDMDDGWFSSALDAIDAIDETEGAAPSTSMIAPSTRDPHGPNVTNVTSAETTTVEDGTERSMRGDEHEEAHAHAHAHAHDAVPCPISGAPTILRLPQAASYEAVRNASRDAWRVFVEQSHTWGKAELVLWVYGLYAPAARWSHRADDDSMALERLLQVVDTRLGAHFVRAARESAITVLASFGCATDALEFARCMHEVGAVTRCTGAPHEDHVFIPTPESGTLVDRVLALIAADVLNAPEDFQNGAICSGCGGMRVGSHDCAHTDEGGMRESELLELLTFADVGS